MASEKRQLRGRGNGETDRKDLCVERQNIDIFWKKSRRAEQELVRLGKKGRKHDRVCRRNRNGEGEVMLTNPSCFLMFKNQTIYFISWIVFLKQDTFSCYSRLSVHNT